MSLLLLKIRLDEWWRWQTHCRWRGHDTSRMWSGMRLPCEGCGR